MNIRYPNLQSQGAQVHLTATGVGLEVTVLPDE